MAGNAFHSHPDSPQSHCDLTPKETTTPHHIHQPLTPPSTDEQREREDAAKFRQILDEVTSQGGCQSSTQLAIAATQYKQFSKIIDRDVRRHDYDPFRELLVFRMPSPIHEFFSRSVAEYFRDELDRIATRTDEAGVFASNIKSGGSSRIFLQEGTLGQEESNPPMRRQPDEQFQHKLATYPGVVIEVSYSQDGRDLRRLAQEYILYSNGDIKLVIGIDINDNKECTVSTWRPRYTRSENDDIDELGVDQPMIRWPFRSPNREAINEDDCIDINLGDFATDEISCGDKSLTLSLPFSRLALLLNQAEEVQEAREPRKGQQGIKSTRQTKKRPLSSSSMEELASGDEARFLSQERRTADRAAASDGDFMMKGAKRRL